MTDTEHPAPADDSSLLPGLVKGGAIAGTMTWAFILLSFLAALSGPGGGGVNALGPLLALIVATPIFVLSVLPALLLSLFGGTPGAKAGAAFLLGGLAIAAFVVGVPMLR